MLPVGKHKELVGQIDRIDRRIQNIQEVKSTLFAYITRSEQLYISYADRVFKSMIGFEEKIVKAIFYSTDKSNYILNMSKIYREFCSSLEKNSKINLINL